MPPARPLQMTYSYGGVSESGRERTGGEARRCLVCGELPRTLTANLCEECAAEIAGARQLVPEQIASSNPPGDAALIDAWGRPHFLVAETCLGRRPPEGGVTIIEASVSREHARLFRAGGGWRLRDLGSTNGTSIGEERIEESELSSGDRISIGSVGFFFVTPADHLHVPGRDVGGDTVPPHLGVRPGEPPAPEEETTFVGMDRVAMSLIEPTGGGGGYLQVGDKSAQLTTTQLELISLLARRMVAEDHQPDLVRGFVHSSELMGSISWDTAHPTDNHVKQLVRRVRKTLVRAGIGNLIESRHRFGYRLRVIPVLS